MIARLICLVLGHDQRDDMHRSCNCARYGQSFCHRCKTWQPL